MIGIFLDIESNGLNVMKHRVIEIALKFVDLLFEKEIASYHSIIKQTYEVWGKSDPASLAVNGFKFEMLEIGKTELEVSQEIISLFHTHQITRGKAVYICQNPSFDRSFFSQLVDPKIQETSKWPYHWLDLASMFWSLTLKDYYLKKTPPPWELGISKNNIAKTLGLQEETLPHKAMQGVEHLIECYFALNAKR